MKKYIFAAFLTLMCTSTMIKAESNYCPCPGPCCPLAAQSDISKITSYLSEYVNAEKANTTIETELNNHRVI